MDDTYDWSGFYGALCDRAERLLRGIDDEDREVISLVAETDAFWSDGLQPLLAEFANDGDIRGGVLATLDLWRENVLTVLTGDFAMDLEWGAVTVDVDGPLIEELVEAATPG